METVPPKREIDSEQLAILEMLPLSREQKDNLIMLLLSQEVITEQRKAQVGASDSFDKPLRQA